VPNAIYQCPPGSTDFWIDAWGLGQDQYYCDDPNLGIVQPIVYVPPPASYNGQICTGTMTQDTVDLGTIVFCSEPWISTDQNGNPAYGGWPELELADTVALFSAALLLVAAVWAMRQIGRHLLESGI